MSKNNIPAIPSPTGIDRSLERILTPIKETLDIWAGAVGHADDEVITVGEFADLLATSSVVQDLIFESHSHPAYLPVNGSGAMIGTLFLTHTTLPQISCRATDSGASHALFQNTTTGNTVSDGFYVGITSAENALIWNYEATDLILGTGDKDAIHCIVNAQVDLYYNNAQKAGTTNTGFDINGDLTLDAGTNINEFSIDGTLSGNSDDAVPTEKAVKTYADTTISADIATHTALPNAHHAQAHTVASHSDTSGTGAELNTLTDNSIANALHRHSELVASDGSPDPALSVDAAGRVSMSNDLIVDSDLLFVDVSPGRVGIGITPAHEFHVDTGAGIFMLQDQSPKIVLHQDSAPPNQRMITITTDTQKFQIGKVDDDLVNNAVNQLTILQNGNAGFGTVNPGQEVEIYSGNPVLRIRDSGATAGSCTAYIEFGGTDAGAWSRTGYVGDGSSFNANIYLTAEVADLLLDAAGDIILTSGGAGVGIGIASPAELLHTFKTTGDNSIRVETNDGLANILLDGADTNGYIGQLRFDNAGDSVASVACQVADADEGNIEFWTQAAGGELTEKMRIDPGGKVGILTTDPQGRLHVKGPSNQTTKDGIWLDTSDASDFTLVFSRWAGASDDTWRTGIKTNGTQGIAFVMADAVNTLPTNTKVAIDRAGIVTLANNLLVDGGDIGITADTNLMQLAANSLTVNGLIDVKDNVYMAAGKELSVEKVRARGAEGLTLEDDGDNLGIFIADGGIVTLGNDLRVDGGQIGITADPDLISMANGALTVNGTLGLLSGTTINEFSIDGTLAGNSDDAVPTEKAVKAYADAAATVHYHDTHTLQLDNINSNGGAFAFTTTGAVTLNQDLRVDGGDIGITADTDLLQLASAALKVNGTLGLLAGTTINELSIDGTLAGDSDDAVPTEKAVKTYVDGAAKPAFSVKLSADQLNIALVTEVTVQFSEEIYDQNNDFTAETFTFTAPVTGKYHFSVSILLQNLDWAATEYRMALGTSNRDYTNVISPRGFADDVTDWTLSLSVDADMDANDTAIVHVWQGGGTVQTDLANEPPTYFTGHLVFQ